MGYSSLSDFRLFSEKYPPEHFASLKAAIISTASSFGVNPDDVHWKDEKGEDIAPQQNEIRLSPLYPKMLFHKELVDNLSGTGFTITDCVQSPDGKSLEFFIEGEDKSKFNFTLISDPNTTPLASYLTIIIDKIQSLPPNDQEAVMNSGAMYAYILTPGEKGFTKTRERLLSSGIEQILYEIPFSTPKFIRLMNAASHIVGLKKVKNLEQAMNILKRLAGNFKYIYARGRKWHFDDDLLEQLNKSNFIIFCGTDTDYEEAGNSTANGKIKLIPFLNRITAQNSDLRLQILNYHRRMLFTGNWGIIIVDSGQNRNESLKKTSKILNRLNCVIIPISQMIMRIT